MQLTLHPFTSLLVPCLVSCKIVHYHETWTSAWILRPTFSSTIIHSSKKAHHISQPAIMFTILRCRCSNAVLLEICLFQGRQRLSCKSLAIRLKNVKKKQFPASRAAASLGRSFRLCSKILKAHLLWGGCAWSCCKSPCRMAWLNTGQRLDAPTTSTTVFCVHLFSYRALRGISRNLSLDVDTRDAWYRFIKVT